MEKIYLDFETRSACDLVKCGSSVYAEHETTDILCVALARGDSKVQVFSDLNDPTLNQILISAIQDESLLFEAHNAFFEYNLFNKVLAKKLNLPELPITRWRCSAALAVYNGLPRSLKAGGAALGLDVQKDEDGRDLMLLMCKPITRFYRGKVKKIIETLGFENSQVPDEGEFFESPEALKRLCEYCVADVETERQLVRALPKMADTELEVWLLDFEINAGGINVDTEAVDAAMFIIMKLAQEANESVLNITGGVLTGITKRAKVMTWCRLQGVPLENYQADYLRQVLAREDLPETVREVLSIRQEFGKTSTSKYAAFKNMTCSDSRARGLLKYYGAHTGRWSGNGIQPQNLPRGAGHDIDELIATIKLRDVEAFKERYPKPIEAISGAIRGCFCAREGKILIGADYASIEARVLLWLAQDERGLALFREGKDLYVDMAADIFNTPIESVDKEERQLGKCAILGLGYGMGATKFYNTCVSQGILVDEDTSAAIVIKWRKKYVKIVSAWRAIERAAKQAVLTGRPCGVLGISFFVNRSGSVLKCRLPSGRLLSYVRPVINHDPEGFENNVTLFYQGISEITQRWTEKKTWGGKLVENIIQAIARDVMADAMVRMRRAGFTIILTVHDEVILEEDKGFDKQKLIDLMRQPPEWGKDIPLDAEAWAAHRYAKR